MHVYWRVACLLVCPRDANVMEQPLYGDSLTQSEGDTLSPPKKRRRVNQEVNVEFESVVHSSKRGLTRRTRRRDFPSGRIHESSSATERRPEPVSSSGKVKKSHAESNREYRSVRLFLVGNYG